MNIWREIENDDLKLNPVTLKDIEEVENLLSIHLPECYKKIILEQNGGTIVFNAHPSPQDTAWGDFVKIEAIRGIGEKNGILESDYFISEWDLPAELLLLDGDGHSWIGLDYRQKKANPPVVYIDKERDQFFELAPNFDVFLSGLYIEETDSSYGDIEVEYDYMPSYTEEELLEEFASADIARCMELIIMMSYSYGQDFVLKNFIKLMQRQELVIREAVASEFLSFIVNDTILSIDLYNEMLQLISEDPNESVRVYAGFIKDEMATKK